MNRRLCLLFLSSLCWSCPGAALAENWPSKPIRLIIPFAPGGSADTLGRIFAHALSDELGQRVYAENRGGAGGVVAAAQVARAEPDGYTLMVSGIASHVIGPALNTNVDYDPIQDFTHIAYLGGPPIVWVAHPSLGVTTFEGLLKLLRGRTEPLSYGSPGPGTQGHLVAASLIQKLALPLVHVPYKGANPVMLDVVAGHIRLASVSWTTALPHIRARSVVPLAITASRRFAEFPTVPTLKELGYPDLVATAWFSLSGPSGIPPEIVHRLNVEVTRALDGPLLRRELDQEGISVESMDPDSFAQFVKAEIARWTPIVRASGATAE